VGNAIKFLLFEFLLFGVCRIGTPAAQSAPAGSISVSAYVRLTDPLEQAFSLDAPAGWHTEGGLARRAALQINPYVRSLSADKMTYLMLGEPTLPSFTPPKPDGQCDRPSGRHPVRCGAWRAGAGVALLAQAWSSRACMERWRYGVCARRSSSPVRRNGPISRARQMPVAYRYSLPVRWRRGALHVHPQ